MLNIIHVTEKNKKIAYGTYGISFVFSTFLRTFEHSYSISFVFSTFLRTV